MSDLILRSLDISNFRSIRGQIHAPLDAKVVLVHGENGAGKTSLLSAIELALTGRVQSLERADPKYEKQLLHRSASGGSVAVQTTEGPTEGSFKALLSKKGAEVISVLDSSKAMFFRERAFLPQSLLGQLLQIYQEAGSDLGSPLAQFVGKLLGLDRLDALEAGLKPLVDVRNVRKNVDGWLATENEKSRLDRLLSDQQKRKSAIQQEIDEGLDRVSSICEELELVVRTDEESLGEAGTLLADGRDIDAFARLADQQRQLASLRREIETAQDSFGQQTIERLDGASARDAYAAWQTEFHEPVEAFRVRVQSLFPDVSLESDPAIAAESALSRLRVEEKQLAQRAVQGRGDIVRHSAAQNERDVAVSQRTVIDEEIGQLSSSAGSLGSALAELTSFIEDDICPVCDRDFSEVTTTSLSEHVHEKVRTLSASAERLLTLGRTRTEAQVTIERLDHEIEAISARSLDEEGLANLERRLADVRAVVAEIDGLLENLRVGSRLLAADVLARRAVSRAQSRDVALSAARATLSEFAVSIGADPIAEGEPFDAGADRLDTLLAAQAAALEHRLVLRRRGIDLIAAAQSAIARRVEVESQIAIDFAAWQRTDHSLELAQGLRDQGNTIRNAVDAVRSEIIRREFNERLNRVWRDLFVRLAPVEPFVPAFCIPADSTQRLQPKLITDHRDGGEAGGAPGAMLSSGNLNTAALTLFIALHLSVPKELPWLILDDPVQSMDDVHIAHFAALLRTLSKEHGRQVIIAVHDRQLFEYLKLELSPAFLDDSLLTLELSRGARRDSLCVSQRFSFKEETALLAA